MTTWVMIPARGGSVGVPRKNVRRLKDKPLISWTIEAALGATAANGIIVMTDDDEIESIAHKHGVRVMREEKTTGKQTLDDVARKVITQLLEEGAHPADPFITVQPTCPFIKGQRIGEAVELLKNGAGSVLTVVDDRHLTWTTDADGTPRPEYAARVNRQLLPPKFRETGGVIATTIGNFLSNDTRIVEPIKLVEVGTEEALDIDHFADWMVAEYLATKLSVMIRVDAAVNLGMGHVYRALALAQELAMHDLQIVISSHSELSRDFFAQHPFRVTEVESDEAFYALADSEQPDMIILDHLDTTAAYVERLKVAARAVVTFEDLGEGAERAHLLVSDLYRNRRVPAERQLNGVRNAILSPAFNESVEPIAFRDSVEHLLVVFGGTDPSGLTLKTLEALRDIEYRGEVSVVRGLGAAELPPLSDFGLDGQILHNVAHMPSLMAKVDLAISSAGRTITELLSLGVPVICIAQNDKELTHTHASVEFGVLNLGLGSLCDVATVGAHIRHVLNSNDLRRTLHERALDATSDRTNGAVIERILDTLTPNN